MLQEDATDGWGTNGGLEDVRNGMDGWREDQMTALDLGPMESSTPGESLSLLNLSSPGYSGRLSG